MSKKNTKKQVLFILSLVDIALILFVSLYGMLASGLYENRLNSISTGGLLGQDIIILLVALFSLPLAFQARNNSKARIALLGCLSYFIYLYAYMSFGIINSIFTLLYFLIQALSIYLFIFMLLDYQTKKTVIKVKKKFPGKPIAIFFIIIIAIVTAMELKDLITLTIIEQKPYTNYQAFIILDLCLLFPAMIISAIMTLKKKSWGYLLSGIFLIKTLTLMPAIILSDILYWKQSGEWMDLGFTIMASVITMITALFTAWYFKNIKSKA